MRSHKDNSIYLHHIVDAGIKIKDYLLNHSFSDFIQNEWDQDAVIRNLEIIGEAANNLDKELQQKHSQIPWRTIINLRNVLVHDYADIDVDVVWKIINDDLPQLVEQISQITL